MSSQDLLLDSTHGKDLSPEGDLSCHGQIGSHLSAREQAGQGHHHGDARGRSVLGDRSCRHMQVQVRAFKKFLRDTQVRGIGTDVAQCSLGTLLHHVPQLPGEQKALLSFHPCGLDEQDVPTCGRPRKTRGDSGRRDPFRHLGKELRMTQVGLHIPFVHLHDPFLPLDNLTGHGAADRGQFPFQVPHPGLPGVISDNAHKGGIRDFQMLRFQPVFSYLFRKKVFPGDLELVLFRVSRQFQYFHPVSKGRWDRFQDVGRGNEKDPGKIKGDLEVVVGKGGILLGIQNLEKSGRRIPPKIGTDLVDLIQHEHRVVGPGLAKTLDHAPRKGAHIGPPVPADLRLVPHAPQGNAKKLAFHGPCNGLAQRGFSHSRRPHKT